MNESKEQYVYVMSNSSFDSDMLKIGYTKEHPIIRANNLHTSGVPTPFIIEYVIITPDGFQLEKQIHHHIAKYRVKSNREFFKISKDKLTEILINELMLDLTAIDELPIYIPTKLIYGKKLSEIKTLYESLKKDAYNFFSKFEKDSSELVVKKINNKMHVFFTESVPGVMPLSGSGFDDVEEQRIINIYNNITRRINDYGEMLDYLLTNYEEIKKDLSAELLRHDNKYLKTRILDTHKDLCTLKDAYIWEF